MGNDQSFVLVFPDSGNRESYLLGQDPDRDQGVFGLAVACRLGHRKSPSGASGMTRSGLPESTIGGIEKLYLKLWIFYIDKVNPAGD